MKFKEIIKSTLLISVIEGISIATTGKSIVSHIIRESDIVRLKTSDIPMTVIHITKNNNKFLYYCKWFDAFNTINFDSFYVNTLAKVKCGPNKNIAQS